MNKNFLILNLIIFASQAKEQCISCICKDENGKISVTEPIKPQCNMGPNKKRNRELCDTDAKNICKQLCEAQNKNLHKYYIWGHNPTISCSHELFQQDNSTDLSLK